MTPIAMRVTIPEKLLYELEAATRMPDIRPGTDMDMKTLMYQSGKRWAFKWVCAKAGVDPLDVQRKAIKMLNAACQSKGSNNE